MCSASAGLRHAHVSLLPPLIKKTMKKLELLYFFARRITLHSSIDKVLITSKLFVNLIYS